MIYGIGTDIVSVNRISSIYSRQSDRFVSKILSGAELALYNNLKNHKSKLLFLAGRWAAKEAFVKAIGTGFRSGMYLRAISIINNELGRPEIKLSEQAKVNVNSLLSSDNYKLHISLSNENEFATSTVLVEIIN